MSDPFSGVFSGVSDPATRAALIVLSDTTDLPAVPKGIYVGTGGDLVMIGVDDPDGAAGTTWRSVPAGAIVPFRARRVLATGTTADDLLALI